MRRLVHAPLRRPRPPSLLGHDYGDGAVEGAAAPALEQERYLGHDKVGLRILYAPVGLAAHERVQDLFEVLQGLRVPEDLAAERPAVHAVLFKDVPPEAFYDPRDSFFIFGEEVVHDLVRRDRLGAQSTEHIHEGALA